MPPFSSASWCDISKDPSKDPSGQPALRPFQDDDEFKAGVSSIFHHVDPVLGGYFDTMRSENLLDLVNRKNKAPGGYCTSFPVARRPSPRAGAP